MMRLVREYGFAALLGLGLLAPLFGAPTLRALSLPTQSFTALQEVNTVASQLRETPGEARELTQSLVASSLRKSGVNGSVDVEAVIASGDLSSIAAIEGLSPLQQQALVENVRRTYVESSQLIDRAKLLSARAATIHQPGDGEGGGFGGTVSSALTNSSQDVLSDLNAYQEQLDQTLSQLEDVEKYWKLLQMVLAAKPAFLPEKTDNDTFVVCVNHVGPAQLYQETYASLDVDLTALNQAYASVLDEVNASVQKYANVSGRLSDFTDNPLSAVEIAAAEKGDYGALLAAASAQVSGTTGSVAQKLSAQYGSSLDGLDALDEVQNAVLTNTNLDGAGSLLDETTRQLDASLGEQNASLIGALSEAGDPASLAAVRQALGPEGAALANRYSGLLASRDRAEDPAAVDAALEGLRGSMAQQLQISKNETMVRLKNARDLASTFDGKSPTELIADAQRASERVGERAEGNLANATQIYSRLTNMENYQQTLSAELETWQGQENDFSYITDLTAILGLIEQLKPPTI